jgi:sec-independent protein translocase protein TatC
LADVEIVGDRPEMGAAGRASADADVGVARAPLTDEPVPGGQLPPAPSTTRDDKVMSLVEHLSELRRRVAISIAAILVGSVLGFVLAPGAIALVARPVLGGGPLIFLDLGGAFFLQLKVGLAIGFALALPVVLYQVWAFVAPGLTARERRLARPWVPAAIVFFALGVVVAYIVLPFAAAFLLSFQIPGVVRSQLAAGPYFDFVTIMFLGFGVVMQFPILLVLLTKLGILSIARLRSSRRYALLIIVIFAVVVTPGGDPISPTVMSVVMYALYEATIVVLSRQQRSAEVVRG